MVWVAPESRIKAEPLPEAKLGFRMRYSRLPGKNSSFAHEKSRDVEFFEHDFTDLLSLFRFVNGRLGQKKGVLAATYSHTILIDFRDKSLIEAKIKNYGLKLRSLDYYFHVWQSLGSHSGHVWSWLGILRCDKHFLALFYLKKEILSPFLRLYQVVELRRP